MGIVLFVMLPQVVIATTVSVEVRDSAFRLRSLYREGGQVVHLSHHIDLLTAPGAPRSDDYHLLAAELSLPLGITVSFGALALNGTALLLYRPLAYSAQSRNHYWYRTVSVDADTVSDRSSRYGLSLSYTDEALMLQVSAYTSSADEQQINVNWALVMTVTEWFRIEQWSAFTTVSEDNYDDWWFREQAYFTGTHFFTHALRFHLLFSAAYHVVCSSFLQHSAFHIPQYAFSCAGQLRWKRAGSGTRSVGETHVFIGVQSEYYASQTGQVDDEWLIGRLRHRHYFADYATLTIGGEVGGYKPSSYYRQISFDNAIPRVSLSANWDHLIDIGDSLNGVRYGMAVDFSYDWREATDARARVRLSPRVSFSLGELFLFQLLTGILYEEPLGWEEFTLSPRITLNIIDDLRIVFSSRYEFDIPMKEHRELSVGGRINWDATEHIRFHLSATADVLDFSEFNDLEYRIGLSAGW